MGRRKGASKRQAATAQQHTSTKGGNDPASTPAQRRIPSSPLPTVFEVVLRLPWDYGLVPIASLLVLSAHALHWAARALFIGLVWNSLVFLADLLVFGPIRLVRRARQAVGDFLTALLVALVPAYEDARALRTSLARLEKRLKRTEQNLKQQHKALQRLLQQPPSAFSHHHDPRAPSLLPAAPATLPLAAPAAAAPLPPPPPPPVMPRASSLGATSKPKASSVTGGTLAKARPTPPVTLQDLMRVKLKPTQPKVVVAEDECGGNSANSSFNRSLDALSGATKRKVPSKGLSVSLADITNVQLRRAVAAHHSTGSRGSPLKVPAGGFQLKRVQGIERSPGGTPIRPDIVKSSHNNTVDKFAIALKKKFESSLISSPPRSTHASPAGSPMAMPGTPISLNASFARSPGGLAACLSPSASFLDSSVLSPIRADKL